MKYSLGEHDIDDRGSAFVAPSASVIGRVTLGPDASVWFGAVIRGDTEDISVGARSNVQDGAVLHADPGSPLVIGDDVTIGHKAMLHGCTVGDASLIGIGAIVLNNAAIGKESLVGANALVTEGKSFPPRSLLVGAPARVLRELTEEEVAEFRNSARHYVDNGKRYATSLRETE